MDMDAYEYGDYFDDDYTQDDPVDEILDRMRRDPKYRPTVKKLAASGDAVCRDVMVLWNEHVREMRRLHANH